MNVYVGTNTMQNAYIGEVYNMQIDFRGKTLAQLQSIGWAETKYNANCGLSYGSDGIGVSMLSGSNGIGGVVLELPTTITSSDKITMKFTGVGGSGDTGRLFCSLANTNTLNLLSNNMIETDFTIVVGSNVNDEGITCNKKVNGTATWGVYQLARSQAGSSGFASGECIFDLPNNKVSWNVTAPASQVYSMEGTITTAGKNCIIGTKYFAIWAGVFTSGVTHKLQTAEIIIEH